MKPTLYYLVMFFVLLSATIAHGQNNPWVKTSPKLTEITNGFKNLKNEKHTFFNLDENNIADILSNAPKRGNRFNTNNLEVSFPLFDGNFESFKIYQTSTLSASLAEKYPSIKSFMGYSKSGASLSFSLDHRGLQATITTKNGETTYIQFLDKNSGIHVVYSAGARNNELQSFECSTLNELENRRSNFQPENANDQLLRTYKMAVSATGEYTHFHGGTVADALAAINATITRANMVFETDMAVTFEIQDFTQLIYLDGSTDPYADPSVGSNSNNYGTLNSWGVQLQNNLTSTIGNAAYDIGHLFATNTAINGNAGCIGCVCTDDDATNNLDRGKGAAFTSSNNPIGEYFDLVTTHEIGHQMGANHTWSFAEENGTITNSEPGSGSTIMGYAGITGNNNVVLEPDPYFHYHSIRQITDRFATNSCWQGNNPTTLTNNPPVADAGNDHIIPYGTAYVLRGNATDLDGTDTLYYCWEGTDNGQVTFAQFGPNRFVGSMVRSLPPNTSPNRYVPNLARVASGQLTETNPNLNSDWETVSNVPRALNYALTVRDREPNAVGNFGQTSYDTMQIIVDNTAGPFAVTSQSTSEVWYVGANQTITWDVAGTDSGNVNTPTVNILLSLDSGQTFPITLASNIPNSGTATMQIPDIGGNDISTARIIVEGNNNIFFAMNSADFSIENKDFIIDVQNSEISACSDEDAVYEFTYRTFSGFSGTSVFSTTNLPSDLTVTFNPTSATNDNSPVSATVSGISNLANGIYGFDIVATSGGETFTSPVSLTVYDTNFVIPTLMSPTDAETDLSVDVEFSWDSDSNTEAYLIEIAEDVNFSNIVESQIVTTNNYNANLLEGTTYYWRVTPQNQCGTGVSSSTFSFTTTSCAFNFATDLPIFISSSGSGISYTSSITITEDFPIVDINVLIDITHTFNSDLDIFLISPDGTNFELSTDNGGSFNNYTNTIFDQEASSPITSGSTPFTGSFRPEQDISSLYGTSSLGTWSLFIIDDANGDGGSINTFALELCLQTMELEFTDTTEDVCKPNDATYNFVYATNQPGLVTTFSSTDIPAGTNITFNPPSADTDGTAITATLSGTENLNPDNYSFTITGSNSVISTNEVVELDVYDSVINTPTLTLPENNGFSTWENIVFQWDADVNSSGYFIEIAIDQNFSNIVDSANVDTNSYTTSLEEETRYYWRVTPSNLCGTGPISNVSLFDTLKCTQFDATDLSQFIPANTTSILTSEIEIMDDILIHDINVGITVYHSVREQLDITLTSPNGTVVELSTGNTGIHYVNTIFDQEAVAPITGDMGPSTGNFIPEGDLSALYNTSAQGIWTLTVVDDVVGVGGEFRDFSLYICTGVTLSVNDIDSIDNDIKLYPNPNNGSFTISSSLPMDKTKISVFDINGRLVYQTTLNKNTGILNERLNLQNLESGVYLIEIDDNVTKAIRRMIINK